MGWGPPNRTDNRLDSRSWATKPSTTECRLHIWEQPSKYTLGAFRKPTALTRKISQESEVETVQTKGDKRRGWPNAKVRSCIKANSHQGQGREDGAVSPDAHQTSILPRDGQLCVVMSWGTQGADSQAVLGMELLQGLSRTKEECTTLPCTILPNTLIV